MNLTIGRFTSYDEVMLELCFFWKICFSLDFVELMHVKACLKKLCFLQNPLPARSINGDEVSV